MVVVFDAKAAALDLDFEVMKYDTRVERYPEVGFHTAAVDPPVAVVTTT